MTERPQDHPSAKYEAPKLVVLGGAVDLTRVSPHAVHTPVFPHHGSI
jgi:hypothetical protein